MDNSDDYSGYGGGGQSIVDSMMHYDPNASGYEPHDFSQGYPPAPSAPSRKPKRPAYSKAAPAPRRPAAYKQPKHAPTYYDRPPPSPDSDSGSSSDSSSSSAGGYGPPPPKRPTKHRGPTGYAAEGGSGPVRGPPKAKRAPSAWNQAVSAYRRKNGGSMIEASRAVAASNRR